MEHSSGKQLHSDLLITINNPENLPDTEGRMSGGKYLMSADYHSILI